METEDNSIRYFEKMSHILMCDIFLSKIETLQKIIFPNFENRQKH